MDVYFTIDLDLFNYIDGAPSDEMELAFPIMRRILGRYPDVKTTWFIRLDGHIGEIYGKRDFIFKKFDREIGWLNDNGHEVGWHFHSYRKTAGEWKQNTSEADILAELNECGQIARDQRLNVVRMGWGYHTNATLATLHDLGFLIDSSAIPRPQYAWETSVKNWIGTPAECYYPSVTDYRVPGSPSLSILEFPISVCDLSSPHDTMQVKRYLNPAYKNSYFEQGYSLLKTCPYINIIMHPYEILPGPKHELLSFDPLALEQNLDFLIKNKVVFKTVSEILIQKS